MPHSKRKRSKPWLIVLSVVVTVWIIAGTYGMVGKGILGYNTDVENRIVKLSPGLPAQQSGLREGDLIRNIEGKNGSLRSGQTIIMVVERGSEIVRLPVTAVGLSPSYRRFRMASGVMAAGFLACGLMAFLLVGSRESLIFLLFTFGRANYQREARPEFFRICQ